MATRVNTKFVIVLAIALVMMVGGAIFVFSKYLKSAEDYARLGEEAMSKGKIALAAGEIEDGNGQLVRATRNFVQAKQKDAKNTAYLYRAIEAQNMIVCDDLTLAYNHLDNIRGAAASIHDTPNASVEDRAYFYELMHDQHRMDLIVNDNSAIAFINYYANIWLNSQPGDPLAMRYLAIAEARTVEADSKDSEERQAILENLTAAIEAHPKDAWLYNAAGKYHLGNARRIYRASGSAFTDEVNATFYRAYEELTRAAEFAKESGNTPALVETMGLMLQISSRDETVATEIIGNNIETARLLNDTLKDKAERDKLHTQELNEAARYIGRLGTGIEGHPFDGLVYSLDLAKQVVKDRPDDPAAHALLGSLYSERAMLDEAEQSIEDGLKVLDSDRKPNAKQFVLDVQARLSMLSTLSEVKTNKAQRLTDAADADQRKQLLIESAQLVEQLAKAPTPKIGWRDAKVQSLRGRIEFARNRPKQAVVRFEKANQYYNNSDLQTLRFLAETHRRLGNDGKMIEAYERIVEIQPNDPLRLNLVSAYLALQDDQLYDKAEAQLNSYLAQFPNNVSALRLRAKLLELRGQNRGAIALLEQLITDDTPEPNRQSIERQIAGIKTKLGEIGDAREILWEQLTNRPEGADMNLQIVNQYLALMPSLQQKLEALDRLEQAGLPSDIANIMRKFSQNGRLTLEDELALLEAQDHTPGSREIRKFMIYRRWNQPDEARKHLDRAVELEPNRPEVIEWRFRMALMDQRWADAEKAISDMLKLDVEQRPDIAVADGVFMKANIIASKAVSTDPSPERDSLLRDAAAAYERALEQYSHYVDGWVQLGRVQIIQDNYFGAQESLREALSRQSRNLSALEYMARSEIATDDEQRALERFAEILRIQPNHPTALDQFSALAMKLNVPSRAIAEREKIRTRVPSNTGNRRALALLLAEDLSYDRAKEEIDAVIKLEGRTQQNLAVLSRVLILGDKVDQAIEEVSGYLASQGDQATWIDHLLMAQTYEMAKMIEEADASFAKARSLEDKESARATLAWGQTLQQRGELEKAAAVYESLSKDRPDNDTLKLQTAQVYFNAQNFEKAEAIALTAKPSPDRFQLLIQTAAGANRVGDAIQRAREGVKTYPSNLNLRLQLTRLLLATQVRRPEAQRDLKETVRLAEQLLADYPERVETQLLIADVYLATKRNDEAIGQLEKILEFAPTHLQANEKLYAIKVQEARELAQTSTEASQAKANEALGIVALLIKSRPDLPILHRRGGEAAELANKLDDAVTYYRQAFDMTNSAQDLASYAAALLGTGQAADARSVLENPEHTSMVANNLFLRALRGRALAGAGEPGMAKALFQGTLRTSEQPAQRQMLVRQLTLAFEKDPDQAVAITEEALGKNLPVEIDFILSTLMVQQRRYADAAARMAKYEENPVSNPQTQFQVLMQLAVARQQSSQYEEAKQTYEKAIGIMDEKENQIPMRSQVHLLNNLAYLLADDMSGYGVEAVKYARKALALLPKNEIEENVALIEDTLGWALFKAGNYEEAITVLSSSVDKYALSANQLHLGRAYLQVGRPNEALMVLEAARNKARAEQDPEMIKETEKWHQKAVEAG